MATITERNGKFKVEIRKKGFKSITKSFPTRSKAEKWADETERSLEAFSYVDNSIAQRTTFGDAMKRYKREIAEKKEYKQQECSRINIWLNSPLRHKLITTLKGSDFARHRDSRLRDGKANNTVRLELQLASHLFNIARKEWEGFEGLKNPLNDISKPSGSNSRTRRLEETGEGNEFDLILNELSLSANRYARLAFILAVETSMRKSLLLKVKWGWVNLAHSVIEIPPQVANAKKNKGVPTVIPLTPTAKIELMQEKQWLLLRSEFNSGALVVNTTASALNNIWRRRIKGKLKIANLRWHDLRHEATSRYFEMGLETMEVSSITGHKSMQMLKRYTHLRAAPLVAKLAEADKKSSH